jgi:hypothetical protein
MDTLMEFSPPVNLLAILSLLAAVICAVIIVVDLLAGQAQHMWIMNIVWPATALYFGPLALWAYLKWGRSSSHRRMMEAKNQGGEYPAKARPFWQACCTATTHCGSGCALGDIISEWALFFFPFALFGHKLFAGWVVDFVAAFLLGIAFQYFTIKPMRNLPVKAAFAEALKADSLSIAFWQAGMYVGMAIATFDFVGHEISKKSPVFWFVMQLAMWCGFVTAYPVNAWLLKQGIKKEM